VTLQQGAVLAYQGTLVITVTYLVLQDSMASSVKKSVGVCMEELVTRFLGNVSAKLGGRDRCK